MTCERFQTEGMRFLDGELTSAERERYESHVATCEVCAVEMAEMGRVVRLTDELRLREPDDQFWRNYWTHVYRRLERGTGFIILLAGLVALMGYAVFHAVTSPAFFTFKGITLSAVIVGLLVVFVSVARERYHESQSDPYKDIER